MSINEVRYLPECGSTNAYVKEHFEEFGPVAAVYTENQTAGRGRLGRSWVNAEGKALYYTVAIKEPLAQPATLPLLASLAVRRQLQLRYGVDCQIKWPNDLLLNGKKLVGILCESVSYGYQQQGRGILCGIGINLAQPLKRTKQHKVCARKQHKHFVTDARRKRKQRDFEQHTQPPHLNKRRKVYRRRNHVKHHHKNDGQHNDKHNEMFLYIGVGAAAFRQIAHLVDAHCLGTSLCS